MRKLSVFDQISMDGYFATPDGDQKWMHEVPHDKEFDEFTSKNAGSGGALVFGRVTYQVMESFWPTPAAAKQFPDVAKGMNAAQKIVFSRTLERATWNNTRLVRGDAVGAMRELKAEDGPELVILGSGSLVAQFAQAKLIDELRLLVLPVVLGAGRTLFEGVTDKIGMALTKSQAFKTGQVFLTYEPRR